MSRLRVRPPLRPHAIEPSPWAQLVALLGEGQAQALSEQLGGRRVYVPRQMSPGHPLAVVLGLGPAETVCGAFGGEHLDIPLAAGRRERIVKLRRVDKLSIARIQAQVGCSRRLVYLALEKARDGEAEAASEPKTDQLKLL